MNTQVDFHVQNQGNLFLFTIHSDAAREFVSEHIPLDDWQWWTKSTFAVDHRLALDLAQGLAHEGFVLD